MTDDIRSLFTHDTVLYDIDVHMKHENPKTKFQINVYCVTFTNVSLEFFHLPAIKLYASYQNDAFGFCKKKKKCILSFYGQSNHNDV